MKKLLIVLMVVAMASFLFVGCLGTTPPIDPDEPVEPVVQPTVAPIITGIAGISLTSTATQYINNTEASLVVVSGTAPTYSEVKITIDAITAGTGDVGATGTFAVVIAKADLGTDGAKTLYATATEAGLAESAHSVEYAFTLDTVKPGIASLAATADRAFVNSIIPPVILTPAGTPTVIAPIAFTGNSFTETGTWHVIGITTVGVLDLQIISPSLAITNVQASAENGKPDTVIPGLTLILNVAPVVGDYSKVTVSAIGSVTAIAGRATLKFNEDVSSGAANAGTYASNIGVIAAPPFVFKESNDTAYWTNLVLGINAIMAISVSDVADLAGNTITAFSSASCTVGPASLTALAP